MKRIVALVLAMIFLLSFSPVAFAEMKYTPNYDIYSQSVYLIDENGLVLYEKNPHQRMYPLELTQVMTAIIAIENIDKVGGWETTAKYDMTTQNYLYDNRNGTILCGMLSGYEFTAEELFNAMIITSGYDASMLLATIITGEKDPSKAAFVAMMNEKAQEIGAKDTNFANCHGLHDTANYTTAYDMYLICKYAMGLEKFRETVKKSNYTCEETDTHPKLIWNTNNGLIVSGSVHYYSPVQGIKAGYSKDIDCRNVASYAEYEDFAYYQVCLGAPFELDNGYNRAMVDTKNLYMWAFTEFEIKTLVEAGSQVAEVPLELAWQKDSLKLQIGSTFKSLLPVDIDVSSISYQYDIPESVEAPIDQGEKIGSMQLLLAGETIGTVPLVAAESVEQSDILSALKNISDITHSFWFKLIFVILIIIVLLYVALMIVRNYNHKKYANYKKRKHY